jgi:hypothetical protein
MSICNQTPYDAMGVARFTMFHRRPKSVAANADPAEMNL